MKTVRKIFAVAAVSAFIAACGGQAHAAPAVTVKSATGADVFGTALALAVKKDTSTGTNRVQVLFLNGWLPMDDDRSWSRYAALRSGFGVAVDATYSPDGLVFDVSKSNGVVCQGGTSKISFPTLSAPQSLADGCAFFSAAAGGAL